MQAKPALTQINILEIWTIKPFFFSGSYAYIFYENESLFLFLKIHLSLNSDNFSTASNSSLRIFQDSGSGGGWKGFRASILSEVSTA